MIYVRDKETGEKICLSSLKSNEHFCSLTNLKLQKDGLRNTEVRYKNQNHLKNQGEANELSNGK